MVPATSPTVDFEQALRLVSQIPVDLPVGCETLPLLLSRGRVLGLPVAANRDQPPFDRATRDGFAVKSPEFDGRWLQIAGTVRAGEGWRDDALPSGAAIEIMTGAPVPPGADAVAMVEHVTRNGSSMRASEGRRLRSGENVVSQGSEARLGQQVIEPGCSVGAAEIALAAACGYSSLNVYLRPKVAIVATGDELIELGQNPGPVQIYNSNSYALAAMVEAAGGEAIRLPITADRREAVAASLEAARACDLIVLSGGVSMGEYDFVTEMLRASGAEFFFNGVRMQPGKPVVFGRLPAREGKPARLFFGLPGNPISTQVTFHCFVEPLLRRMSGMPGGSPHWSLAYLAEDIPGKPGITRLLPAKRQGTKVHLVGWHGSGDLAANARADCYVELPAEVAEFIAGKVVRVLLR